MKKFLITLTFLFLTHSYGAVEMPSVFTATAKQEQIFYNEGVKFYKKKDFEKSYEIFNKLFLTNLDNILINYYLGRSAFQLEKYEFAVSAYDRILIQQPENHRVRIELGQTYLHMGLWAQALDEFTKVSEGKLPTQVKQRVEKTIALLKDKQKKSIFTIYSLFAMIYDSNINNSSDIGTFDIYSPNLNNNITVSNSAKEESTMIYQAVGSFNYKYKLSDELIWDNNLSSINLKYNNHKEKDVNIVSFNSGPMYYTKNYKTAMTVIVDKVFLGHKTHQFNYYLRPEYTRSFSEKTMYIGAIKVGRINFKNTPDLDAKVIEFSNNLKYLSDDFGLFNLKATIGKEMEINKTRTDVSYDYYDFFLGNSINIFDNYTLMSNVNYKISNFNDYDQNFQAKRKDKKVDYSIGIEKQVANNAVLNLGTTYTKRDSNQEPSNYSKYIIKLSLYMSF